MIASRLRRLVVRIWYGASWDARLGRALLTPASWLFGGAIAWRARRYDRKAVRHGEGGLPPMALPALSVGNLSVGGTGKTPVAAWFAAELRRRGAAPGIVLRGYGDDEWRVHELLNPGMPVVCDQDRVQGTRSARERGADCVVLDDAFQHRRARRCADVVLLSADQWSPALRLLPAGPLREGVEALRRSTAVVITVKADRALTRVDAMVADVARYAPRVPHAVVRLRPDRLRRVGPEFPDTECPVSAALDGRWGVVSGIGDPATFEAQLGAVGISFGVVRRYPDHHAYSVEDVALLRQAFDGVDGVLCTLKDAVKLGPLWTPGAPPLWYVSQTLVVERGAAVLVDQVDRVLSARSIAIPTPG